MTPILLKHIVNELKNDIKGGIISSVHQRDKHCLLLKILSHGRKLSLLMSNHPLFSRIHLTDKRFKDPLTPLRFCSVLRAHIQGACITDVSQKKNERVGYISFKKKGKSNMSDGRLIFELTGKSSNVILIDNNGIVVDALRHFCREDGYPRPVVPNIPFTPLAPVGKREGLEVSGISKDGFDTWNEAADASYSSLEDRHHFQREKKRLSRKAKERLTYLQRKLKNLEGDWRQAEENIKASRTGDILLANFNRLIKGMKEIMLPDSYSTPPKKIIIPLDEKLGPEENIERYFKRARKGKTAVAILKERLRQTEDDMRYMEKVKAKIAAVDDWHDMSEIREELIKKGYIQPETFDFTKVQGKKEPIRRFASSEGLEIMCGRNDYGNELLLKRYACGTDLWFHAQSVSGSHVLLKVNKSKITQCQESIKEAAMIAAYYSKARGEKKAEVVYTEARHVKKPRGAKPGMVAITNYKTLYVRPSDGKR